MPCSLVKGKSCEYSFDHVSTETIRDISGSGLMEVNIRLGLAKIRPQLSSQSHCFPSQLFNQLAVCSEAADGRVPLSRLGSSANDNVTTNMPIGMKTVRCIQRRSRCSQLSYSHGDSSDRRIGILIPTRLRGVSWDILHVKPVPAPGSPTLMHLMRPRNEK